MNVKEFYKSTSGNYESALAIMMNDVFIEKMLEMFFSKNVYNDIISSYESKDFESLFKAAHSFKGVTGNLALIPLFEISSIITEATRSLEEVDIDKEIEELKNKYLFIFNEYQKMK